MVLVRMIEKHLKQKFTVDAAYYSARELHHQEGLRHNIKWVRKSTRLYQNLKIRLVNSTVFVCSSVICPVIVACVTEAMAR